MAAASPKFVSFANAIAWSMFSAGVTATAGPNSSSLEIRSCGSTSASIVGLMTAPSRSPPVTILAPASAASLTHVWTLAASFSRTSGPMAISSSVGSP